MDPAQDGKMIVPDEGTISPVRIIFNIAIVFIGAYWTILLPTFLIGRMVYRRYATPLRSIPGPFLASCTRLWKVRSVISENTQWEHIELHRKYGPVVRIGPNEVSFSSPQVARNLLSAGKRFYKTDFYSVFPPPENPDIFTEIREEVHAMKKKVANVPYSMAAMRQLSPFIDDTIELLVSQMGSFCTDPTTTTTTVDSKEGHPLGAPVATAKPQPTLDLGDWLHYFAFDVLGEVAFGRSFGFLAAGTDKEAAIRTIDNSQKYNGIIGQVPELDAFLRRNPICRYIPALDPANNLITRIAREEMAKRRPFGVEREGKGAGGDGREDLMASLIKGHLKDPLKFHEGDIFAVAHGAIFAGSDSTASTMQSFFWLTLTAPRAYAALKAEIDGAVRDGALPATGNVEWAQAQGLPYFQACLKEAMRLRPAVGLNITRYAPAPDGAVVDGRHFPAGTSLAVNGWVLHRDQAVFGPDADFFRPERWLEDEEGARVMERYMFQFGGGAHVCIGRNLALLEINKVCPRLLRDFNFQLVNPTRELKAKATFFVVQEGLQVYISRRECP
ncbi:putative cytochrome p450 oxidoreductase [Rosellinia necatrix]|uniref:Putative cytochrome p450 oxidoreductase n=1 Tax=Rosellinia necatrix TaxID=77044 RepID=A0A1W2TSA0_ROSNE|nr:putative cytochrome p450 oxidoreductase [Rosellinia necatrix]